MQRRIIIKKRFIEAFRRQASKTCLETYIKYNSKRIWKYNSSSWRNSCPRSVCCRWIVFLGHIHNVSGYFWIRNFFFADSASVHTYPANPAYESATFFIRSLGWEFLNTLRIRNRMNANSGYFFIRWHNNLESSSGVNAYTVCKHNVFASLLLGPFFKPSNVP